METEDISAVILLPEETVQGIYKVAQFLVTWRDGSQNYVPIEPLNRHYQSVQQWYEAQDFKPFEFDFNNPER